MFKLLSIFFVVFATTISFALSVPEFEFSNLQQEFRESNAKMTPFSNPTDYEMVEEERLGSGWRYISSGENKHVNIVLYNHGHKGRKKEYYKFAQDHPFKENNPGRNLYAISEWFDQNNVSFYAPLRKQIEDLEGDYGLSVEPVEVFYHLTNTVKKIHGDSVNICYVGHSEGGASVLFTSMYFDGKHVAIAPSPRHYSPFELTGHEYHKTPKFYNRSKNLTILIGGEDIKPNWNVEFYEVITKLNHIDTKIVGNLTHREIAADSYIGEWGPAVLKGCDFN
jgi:hypothetical protein